MSSFKTREKQPLSGAKVRKTEVKTTAESKYKASSSSTKATKVFQFPRNQKAHWPKDQYSQMKLWCKCTIEQPFTAATNKWLNEFVYQYPTKSGNRGRRDGGQG